jgi:hypothetical protein
VEYTMMVTNNKDHKWTTLCKTLVENIEKYSSLMYHSVFMNLYIDFEADTSTEILNVKSVINMRTSLYNKVPDQITLRKMFSSFKRTYNTFCLNIPFNLLMNSCSTNF